MVFGCIYQSMFFFTNRKDDVLEVKFIFVIFVMYWEDRMYLFEVDVFVLCFKKLIYYI